MPGRDYPLARIVKRNTHHATRITYHVKGQIAIMLQPTLVAPGTRIEPSTRSRDVPPVRQVTGLALIRDELALVEDKLRVAARIDHPWLEDVLRFAFGNGGKRLRPAVAILASKFHPANLDKVTSLAAAIETLHTATLVHDDVIDQSIVRRGNPTLNLVAGTAATILSGDYLFARAAGLAASTENTRVVTIFARTLMTLCAGEIRQTLGHLSEPNLENYLRRIYGKTASLFEASAETGAVLSAAPEGEVEMLRQYGYHLGMAFQIIDDVLDFTGDEKTLGKPAGADLRSGLATLPVLRYLELEPGDQDIRQVLAGARGNGLVDLAIGRIRNSAAIPAAVAQARDFVERAKAALEPLPANIYRRALADLADFVVEREH
jgi:geranylgeranyl pyrophosphate synthase